MSPNKFESARQDRVERLEPEVQRILDVLGHPEALVTDESFIADFSDFGQGHGEIELRRISAALGVHVEDNSVIADIAAQLKGGAL